jgi:hypothetical protein
LTSRYAVARIEHDALVKSTTRIFFKFCGLLRKPKDYIHRMFFVFEKRPPLSPDQRQVERPPPSLQITSNFLVFYGLSHDITLEKKCVAQNFIYSKI